MVAGWFIYSKVYAWYMSKRKYRVQKMGKSEQPFISLPKQLLEYTNFRVGDKVVIALDGKRLIIEKEEDEE